MTVAVRKICGEPTSGLMSLIGVLTTNLGLITNRQAGKTIRLALMKPNRFCFIPLPHPLYTLIHYYICEYWYGIQTPMVCCLPLDSSRLRLCGWPQIANMPLPCPYTELTLSYICRHCCYSVAVGLRNASAFTPGAARFHALVRILSQTACFMFPNGLFHVLKQAVLNSHFACVGKSAALQCESSRCPPVASVALAGLLNQNRSFGFWLVVRSCRPLCPA